MKESNRFQLIWASWDILSLSSAPVQCGVVHLCSEVPPEVAPRALYRGIRHFDTTLKEPPAPTESIMAKIHS